MNIPLEGVKPERSNWRDEELSRRHRELYGWDCPAVDIDFLMIEYNLGKPVVVVDYKKEGAKIGTLTHPSYRALSELATNSGIPFIIAIYSSVYWYYTIKPINDIAKKYYKPEQLMSEKEYVTSLYILRGRIITQQVLSVLSDVTPDNMSF